VAPSGKTDPVVVCLDADVVVAGLFSSGGASHALLVLAEVGMMRVVVPEAAVDEATRNLKDKLPEALPALATFLSAPFVRVHRPPATDLREAKTLAHSKDVPIMAAALGSGAALLVTHNTRHFKGSKDLRVVRPKVLVEEARAWMAKFQP